MAFIKACLAKESTRKCQETGYDLVTWARNATPSFHHWSRDVSPPSRQPEDLHLQ